jgi:hypothetical protein
MAYRAPIKSFASVDEVVHGPDCLFNGRISVWPVAKQQVDIVQLEALQRHLGALNKMFEVNAGIVCSFHAIEGSLITDVAAIGDPGDG